MKIWPLFKTSRKPIGKYRLAVEQLDSRVLPSVWIGGDPGTPTSWSDPNNWLNHEIPTNGTVVQFDTTVGTVTSFSSNNDISNLTLNNIIINDTSLNPANAFNITGLPITLTGGITSSTVGPVVTVGLTSITLGAANTWTNNLGAQHITSNLDLSGFNLTAAGAGITVINGTISSSVAGSDSLSQNGPGTLTLSGNNTYDGNTTVNSGTLLVDGTLTSSPVSVVAGTLGGLGTINNSVSTVAHTNVSPGDNSGTTGSFNVGSLQLIQSGNLNIRLGGVNPGQFDQIVISPTGTIKLNIPGGGGGGLGGVTLNLSLVNGFIPTLGQKFEIVNNQSSSAVSGKFFGPINQGETITVASRYIFTVSYTGGDGNDVMLTLTGFTNVATHFSVSPTVSSVMAGSPMGFTITALDGNNLVASNYTGTVQLTSTDGNAMWNGSGLPSSYTFTSGDAGSHTFNVTLTTAGTQSITATDQTFSGLTITTEPITVTPGVLNKFLVTVLGGSSFVAGNSFLFTVQSSDQFGNPVTSSGGFSNITISATPVDSLSNFPITSGAINSSGFGFFLGTLKTVGSFTLTASGTISGNTLTGTSSSISVTPAGAIFFTVSAPSTATTGVAIPVTVTAYDLYKNVATGYTGAVSLTSTSAGNMGGVYTFSTSGANPDNGTHTFSVTLNSGGTQTVTATDTTASAPNVAGTSNSITTRGLVVTAVTPTPTGFTATFNKAFIPGDVYLYNSNLTTTADVVMVATSDLVSFNSPSGTVKFIYNGRQASPTATFAYSSTTTAAAFQAYLQTIPGLTASGAVVVTGPNGGPFTVNFGPGVTGGALLADLSGFAAVLNAGKISGSLLIDSSNAKITFKATASNLQQKNQQVHPNDPAYSSVVLPDATYTIKLVTGTGSGANANGFFDILGVGLDGANSGGVSTFTTTFTTSFQANATPVLGIPDFARGPDSNTPITIPNQLGFGIPITLYNSPNVTDVTFSLSYNASLLNITGTRSGANSDATDKSGANLVLVSATGGVATFHYTDTTAIFATPDAPLVLGDITAVVPSTPGAASLSLYQVKDQLQFGSIVINLGAVTGAVGSNGIHVNAYAGDVNGDKVIDGLDKLAANFIATNTAPPGVGIGFSAYTQLDPVIVGDVAGDLSVDAGDVTTIDSYVAQLNPLQISQPPTQLLKTNPNYLDPTTIHSPNAADPTLSLTRGLTALGSPVISVTLDHPDPDGSTGLTSASLALIYDPTVLTISVSDITLGSIPSQGTGWQLVSMVDQTTGQIGIEIYSSTPISSSQAGSLVNIAFHVLPGASVSRTAVQLVNAVTPNGQWCGTGVADSQGAMILSPGVNQLVLPTGAILELCSRTFSRRQ